MQYHQELLTTSEPIGGTDFGGNEATTMTDPSKLKRDDLCSFLGYEKGRPDKNRAILLKATSTFLTDQESRGNRIPPRRNPVEARLCAINFLEEEGRGEKFWPRSLDGSLTYENDSQM